jgi:hypothetical protein
LSRNRKEVRKQTIGKESSRNKELFSERALKPFVCLAHLSKKLAGGRGVRKAMRVGGT